MKKIILSIAVLLMAAGASAQSFEWGVKAGLNLATLTKSDIGPINSKMKPSIYVGAFAEYLFNDFIGIQPEVVYSRQGTFYKEGNVKMWIRNNYINIPIIAKIYVLDRLSVDIGPQFGIMLNSKSRYKNNEGSGTEDIDDLKNFDVSVPIGLSYKVMGKVDVTARYILGLTEVGKNGNDKMKNSVIQIGAGYRF